MKALAVLMGSGAVALAQGVVVNEVTASNSTSHLWRQRLLPRYSVNLKYLSVVES